MKTLSHYFFIKINYLLFIGMIGFLFSCNLEKEIDIELPPYNSQIVVECYLEPQQPYTLLLTKSASYFDAFPTSNEDILTDILEEEATVTITHQGEVIELTNTIGFNPFTSKIYNYIATKQVPRDFDNDFELSITTKDGENLSATTRLLPTIPIDSLIVEFSETNDTLARALTYFTDDPNTEDFYRRMLHFNNIDSLQQDFVTNDRFIDNNQVVFGTNFSYEVGDTIISALFHIDSAYHDFLESIANAVAGNGNPFAQPSTIISNIEGNAIGIFTGLSYDRQQVIVE